MCKKDIVLCKPGESVSTSKLTQHILYRHRNESREVMFTEAKEKLSEQLKIEDDQNPNKLQSFGFTSKGVAPNFPSKFAYWCINTFQPLETCENEDFRQLCFSLNPRHNPLNQHSLNQKLVHLEAETKATLHKMLEKFEICITVDGWTSSAKKSYTGITAHFIRDWNLESVILGCNPKHGRARAEDHLRDIESALTFFNINFKDVISCTMDTEPTMNSLARLMRLKSLGIGGDGSFNGCTDHILELTTG
jgi:hypothetical protein